MKIRFGTRFPVDVASEIRRNLWGCLALDPPQSGHQTLWRCMPFGLRNTLDERV